MSRTGAAELARLKLQFARWKITRQDVEAASGPGFSQYVARSRATGQTITDTTLAGLELRLYQVERGWGE